MAPRMAIDIKNTEKLEVEGGSPEKGNRQSSAGKPEPIGVRWCCGNSIEPTLTQYPNGCPGKLFWLFGNVQNVGISLPNISGSRLRTALDEAFLARPYLSP